jgi:hypothetical protein
VDIHGAPVAGGSLACDPLYEEYLRRGAAQPVRVDLSTGQAEYENLPPAGSMDSEYQRFVQQNQGGADVAAAMQQQRIAEAKRRRKELWIAQGLIELED